MMQTNATFHVMPDGCEEDSHLLYACLQAANYYRRQNKVFVFTPDEATAHKIDELLWSFDADSFVPHNLAGEGPKQGAAVEISCHAPTNRRPILINLSSTVPNFANQFSQIIDFVPVNETLKQQARDRFRTCRQWGFQTESQNITTTSLTEETQSSTINS